MPSRCLSQGRCKKRTLTKMRCPSLHVPTTTLCGMLLTWYSTIPTTTTTSKLSGSPGMCLFIFCLADYIHELSHAGVPCRRIRIRWLRRYLLPLRASIPSGRRPLELLDVRIQCLLHSNTVIFSDLLRLTAPLALRRETCYKMSWACALHLLPIREPLLRLP